MILKTNIQIKIPYNAAGNNPRVDLVKVTMVEGIGVLAGGLGNVVGWKWFEKLVWIKLFFFSESCKIWLDNDALELFFENHNSNLVIKKHRDYIQNLNATRSQNLRLQTQKQISPPGLSCGSKNCDCVWNA